jgi:hypothetical protein
MLNRRSSASFSAEPVAKLGFMMVEDGSLFLPLLPPRFVSSVAESIGRRRSYRDTDLPVGAADRGSRRS